MGTGAVGGCFGGLLARSGEEVTLVARGPNLEAIRARGLRVESAAVGDFTVHPRAIDAPGGSWTADLVLFCVKGYDNEQAIRALRPAVGDNTTILTLQNGIGGGDQLTEAFGRERVLLGAAYVEATRKGPGVVAQVGGPCRAVFGEADGSLSARAQAVCDTFRGAEIEAQVSTDISKELWNKLVFICALSGMTCIARAPFAEVIDTPETHELTLRVMREAAEMGRAMGVKLDDDIVSSTMAHFQEFKHELVSSMYHDLVAGNPLELSVLNGAVSRMSKTLGVATPVNDFITACLTVADNRARSGRG